jgi:hypothetical protein
MMPKTANVRQRTRELRAQAQLLVGRAVQAQADAIRVRHEVQLGQLRRRMPEANPLTRAITVAILATHGLWEVWPTPRHAVGLRPLADRALGDSGLSGLLRLGVMGGARRRRIRSARHHTVPPGAPVHPRPIDLF